jgi:hypothetical protein
MAWGIVK